MPSPLDDFAAANVAPPVAPPPPEDQPEPDPIGNPFGESLEIPKGEPPERPNSIAPRDLAAQVQQWWTRTNNTPELDRLYRQVDRDVATNFGMPFGSQNIDEMLLKEDAADLTNQHVYRGAIQSMALTMPEDPQVEIEPEPDCPQYDPNSMQPIPDTDGLDWKKVAFADLLNRLQKKLCKESKVIQNIRTGIQDGHHFEMAVFKTTWQADYRTETMQEDRMPDVQAQIAEAETMMEQFELGEFLESDAEYRTLSDLLLSIEAQTELPIWRGVVVKSIPLRLFRVDGKVKRIEDLHQAEWMRQDYLMSRSEILRRFKSIDSDDLARAQIYQANGMKQANDTREQEQVYALKPDGTNALTGNNAVRSVNDWDLLLVAEIWHEMTQSVYLLVEGLDYYARKYTPNRATKNFYPFRIFVLNRTPGNVRLAGFSDAEMQAKEQDRINRIDSQEDEAARNAIGRGVYDKDLIEDDMNAEMANLSAHEWVGLSFKGRDLSKAFVPLPGSTFDAQAFAVRRQTAQSNMRSMSGIPEAYTGANTDPKFAASVEASVSGANTLNRYRRSLVAELMNEVWSDICQLIVMNMSTEEVVAECGENARAIWDEEPKDRETVYRRMKITVKPSIDDKPNKQELLNGLQLLIQSSITLQSPIPFAKIAPMIARITELPIDVDALIEQNPNQLAMQLAQSVMKEPQAIDPAVLQQLMQILMPIVQQEIAQRAAAMPDQPGAPLPGPGATDGPQTPPMPSAAPPAGGASGGMPPMMPGAGSGGPGAMG